MLRISVDVSVKVDCNSHRLKIQIYLHAAYSGGSSIGLSVQEDTDCSTELLILVEVPLKMACRSTTATD